MRGRRGAGPAAARVLVLAAAAAAASGCGASGSPDATTGRVPASTAAGRPAGDPSSLGADDAEGAAGVVTLCGPRPAVAAARAAVGRFNLARPRLQASTIAFPAGSATAAIARRVRGGSAECDVLVLADADVAALAAEGLLADLQPYAEDRGDAGPIDVVRWGADVHAVRAAFGSRPRPVLAVAAPSKAPGGAIALLDALSGGRVTAAARP